MGWGSLVVTGNTYLVQAGPAGSVLGLVIGALIMLVMSRSYAYLMRNFPESSGAYVYTREVFGTDHGFLAACFTAMTYFAVLWANATSLPLFFRIFFGDIFCFGRLYTLFGYGVYIGEVILSASAIILIGLLCMHRKKLMDIIMISLACLFTIGIFICFAGSLFLKEGSMSPSFVPDSSALSQIVKIAVISQWAFIGFESVSHSADELSFEHKKIHKVLVISVISTLALYVMVTLLSVTAYPEGYDSWLSYIKDLDTLDGLEALPAFYAANRYLGSFGTVTLTLSVLPTSSPSPIPTLKS